MLHMRVLGGGLFLFGFLLMCYNLWRTIQSGKPVTTTVEVEIPQTPPKEGLSVAASIFNAPVLYSILIVFFGCSWGFAKGVFSTIAFVLLVETLLVAMIHMSISGIKWSHWYERLLESWLPFSVLTLLAAVVGGVIQILPTVFSKEAVASDGPMQRVYTPLELAGRDIYVREGCYNCPSQMRRPLVGDVLRYGKSGQLTESIYDFPYQWGSKRTGPDLQREGGKYPNLWHFQHMMNSRTTSIGSNMPAYPWLFHQKTDIAALPSKIDVLRKMGVPFQPMSPAQINDSCIAQGQTIVDDLAKNDIRISPDKEIIAVIAYLQQLGKYAPQANTAAAH